MSVQEVVNSEPWRLRQGQPTNILDPAWSGPQELCDGAITWEGTSRWWFCQKCGYCGTATVQAHNRAIHPVDDVTTAIQEFMSRRLEQGIDYELAKNQLLFITAAALRYAATLPADQVGQYVRDHLIVR